MHINIVTHDVQDSINIVTHNVQHSIDIVTHNVQHSISIVTHNVQDSIDIAIHDAQDSNDIVTHNLQYSIDIIMHDVQDIVGIVTHDVQNGVTHDVQDSIHIVAHDIQDHILMKVDFCEVWRPDEQICQLQYRFSYYCFRSIVDLVVLLFYLVFVDKSGSLSGGAFNQLKLVTLNIVLTILYSLKPVSQRSLLQCLNSSISLTKSSNIYSRCPHCNIK